MQAIKDRIKNLQNKTNTKKNNKNKKTNTTKKKPTVLSQIKSSIKKQVNPSTQTLKSRNTREEIKANIAKNKVIQKNPEKFMDAVNDIKQEKDPVKKQAKISKFSKAFNISKNILSVVPRFGRLSGLMKYPGGDSLISRGIRGIGTTGAYLMGKNVLEGEAPGTAQQVQTFEDKVKKYLKETGGDLKDLFTFREEGGKVGLKKIPAGKAGAGLRALKRKNPSLVREQFKYAKTGGNIAKKKKKKKVKYVGVGKALRGYGKVRRG
jgi:hypothetical protein